MRKLSMITILLCLSTMINAQVHFDVKAGFSPGSNYQSTPKLMNRATPREEFKFSLSQVKPQYYGGLKVNLELGTPFFLESGITYTKSTSVYKLDYTMPKGGPEDPPEDLEMKVSKDLLQIPVDIGVSLGAFDITSGLRFNKVLSVNNELSHLDGYSEDNNSSSWGWQAGVRYALHRVMIGAEFQSETKRECSGMNVNDESLELRCVPGKLVFSLQYRF